MIPKNYIHHIYLDPRKIDFILAEEKFGKFSFDYQTASKNNLRWLMVEYGHFYFNNKSDKTLFLLLFG